MQFKAIITSATLMRLNWSADGGTITSTGTTTGTGTSVSTTPTTTGTQATSSVLTVSPASQNVQPGASVTYTVSSAASAADTLALFVSGLPANVTGTLAQTSITPGGTTRLTIAAAAGAANATTTFTVTGTGATTTQSASATLVVGTGTATAQTPAATTVVPTADFVLSVTPTTQAITAGGEVIRFTISSQPTFRPPTRITLQAQHLPHGIKAYLAAKVITTGQATTLTLLAHQDPPRGSHDITIKGSSRRGVQRITVTIIITRPRD